MTLQDATGRESGAVQYSDGSIWIGNWCSIEGIPRLFATGTIGLGEDLSDTHRCDLPVDVIAAMLDHERSQGDVVSNTADFSAITVAGVVVVTSSKWC